MSTFRPTIMFPIETDDDRVIEKLMYALHEETFQTMQTERNLQTAIGISEIGGHCLRCLARRLAEVPEGRDRTGWKAQVGTFVHAGLEQHFTDRFSGAHSITDTVGARVRAFAESLGATSIEFVLEQDLLLHEYKSLKLGGHCDMFVKITLPGGRMLYVVCDWKILGAKPLAEKAAGKLGATYEIQLDGYGLAWERLGMRPDYTVLLALPRDGELDDAAFVPRRYDPTRVIERLALIESMIDGSEIIGWSALIDSQPRAGHCFDCPRFERSEEQDFFAGFGQR